MFALSLVVACALKECVVLCSAMAISLATQQQFSGFRLGSLERARHCNTGEHVVCVHPCAAFTARWCITNFADGSFLTKEKLGNLLAAAVDTPKTVQGSGVGFVRCATAEFALALCTDLPFNCPLLVKEKQTVCARVQLLQLHQWALLQQLQEQTFSLDQDVQLCSA
jgi:hypothetical protein